MERKLDVRPFIENIWRKEFDNGIGFSITIPKELDLNETFDRMIGEQINIVQVGQQTWRITGNEHELIIFDGMNDLDLLVHMLQNYPSSNRVYIFLRRSATQPKQLNEILTFFRIPLYKLSIPTYKAVNEIANFLNDNYSNLDRMIYLLTADFIKDLIFNIIKSGIGF